MALLDADSNGQNKEVSLKAIGTIMMIHGTGGNLIHVAR